MIRLESQHDVSFPPDAVWPILSKTDWLNRSVGLPPVTYDVKPRAEGGSAITARTRIMGQELRWREIPFEWSRPDYYRVRRIFEAGPFVEALLGMDLQPTAVSGTRVVVYSEITPRHAVGGWLAKRILGPKTTRDMRRIMAHLEEYLRGRVPVGLPRLPVQPVHEIALVTGLKHLRGASQPPALVKRIEQFLRESPDVELTHIRPFAVARQWGADRWEVFRLFLHATRAGLLDLRWEILCPNCRASRQPLTTSLSRIQREAHCEVCHIKYDADFDKSVELKFAVNPAVRALDDQTYCLAGPGGKPHVASQLWLEPGEERAWRTPHSIQPLRLCSSQVKETALLPPLAQPSVSLSPSEGERAGERGPHVLSHTAHGRNPPKGSSHVEPLNPPLAGPSVSLSPSEGERGPSKLFHIPAHGESLSIRCEPAKFIITSVPDEKCSVRAVNPNPFPVLLSLEETDWSDDILTAARAANWQEFRDLFATEVISPTEQVAVGSLVVLFTDLRGSTALYRGIGDAPAYALVRDHFAILREVIGAQHGTVVKTMGDAVMAAFSRVDEALAAVREIHRKIAAQPPAGAALALKSGLHLGPCLAVNANGRLDYFGSTVNLAARLVECCHGGDLAVSEEFFARPELQDFSRATGSDPESLEIRFRGFESPHRVKRIKMV